MSIVAAGVHHVHLPAELLAPGLGGERQAFWLFDWKRIHVGPQRHHRSEFAAPEHGDYAGASNASLHLEA